MVSKLLWSNYNSNSYFTLIFQLLSYFEDLVNVSKTNCMILNVGRSDQPEHHIVYIDNIVIERANCNTFLGAFIYSNQSWSDHISCILHKISKNLSDA